MKTFCSHVALTLVCVLAATAASAQNNPDITDLSVEDLLKVEIVSSASKFPQQTTRAPAAITVITGDEIRRFGYRTLSDVLGSVRGLYISDDRNYTYAGVRGFSRPGDYNSRVLLLIDGHRMNDPIYEQAMIGTEFPVDLEAIDRIEIVRGPGSSLYGTNALFAVVNLVTRTGGQESGARMTAEGGTLQTVRGRASFGRVFGTGADVLLTASMYGTGGVDRLYFPEFDAPETGNGIARHSDDDKVGRLFGRVSIGQLTFHAAYSDRLKHVPTASFSTVFGDSGEWTRDGRGYGDVTYTGAFAGGWSGTARAGYDVYRYRGKYPFDSGDTGIFQFRDFAISDWLGGEFTANRRVHVKHLITAGVESRYVLRQDQYSRELGETTIQDRRRSSTWGLYAQDEYSISSKLLVNGGVRLDHYRTFGAQVTPRAALIYNPTPGTALKFLHGNAFRAPNAYELYYFANDLQDPASIRPETIQTNEAVWEQYYGRRFRSTLSVFHSDIRNLISIANGDADADFIDVAYFANLSNARSQGMEGEIEARLPSDIMARASHAWTSATDTATGESLSNSPSQLAKFSIGSPIRALPVYVATEGAYLSHRLSVQGQRVPGFYLQNVTLTADHLRRVDLTFGVYNLFNRAYGDPGSEEHAQVQIPQNGRTARAKVTYRF